VAKAAKKVMFTERAAQDVAHEVFRTAYSASVPDGKRPTEW